MTRYDTHVHTRFSHDGRDEMAAYAAAVDRGQADGIGFSEHYEFWPGSGVRGFLDEVGYLNAVAGWVARGYRFHPGVEVDWMPEYAAEIKDALARYRFAFVIGSVHNLPSASISGRDTSLFAGEEAFDRIITEYGEAVTSSLGVKEFDVVGHPGVFLRHFAPEFAQAAGRRDRLRDLEDALAAGVARSDKLLEVNTSGLFSARREPCAGRFLLERYRAYGGRTVTLASDAHQAADLRRGFDETAELLRYLGFGEVFLPWDRDHPIPLADYLG